MKKLLIAFAVLVALAIGAAPANALMGMPDDMPGDAVLQPFFLVSMPGMGNTNTLMIMTDVAGGWPASASNVLHYDVLTKESETVYNDWLSGTNWDVVSTDALSIVNLMAPTQRAKLAEDLDGDGVDDHYVGYIEFNFNASVFANNIIAQTMLVDLAAGMASGANVPAKEFNLNVPPTMHNLNPTGTFGTELFSANALATAENLQIGQGQFGVQASWFALLPRYYIVDANGKTLLFIWKSVNGLGPGLTEAHVWFLNADEKYVSSNIPLPYELNIIDVEQYLPASLHSGYPKEGWIEIALPDQYGRPAPILFGDWEWLGYTWLKAVGDASESWTALFPIHRDVWWPGK